MKYGPGEQAVPKLHSSGFNLLSALGCGRVGIPFLDVGGVGGCVAKQYKGQGRHICLEKNLSMHDFWFHLYMEFN